MTRGIQCENLIISPMPHIAYVTCREMPEPDHDATPLRLATQKRGWQVSEPAWDDEQVKWPSYDLAVIRSTWNYQEDLPAFLAWLKATSDASKLLNPERMVRQNVHKGYLLGMEASGIPVVPTELYFAGDKLPSRAKQDSVIKPAVSCGSWHTYRVPRGEKWPADLPEMDWIIQPYLRSVEDGGEVSVICIDGEPTHAITKRPRFQGDEESVSETPLLDEHRSITADALESLGETPLYARVDLMRDDRRQWLLSELELIEPSLFFVQNPAAIEQFLDAIELRF